MKMGMRLMQSQALSLRQEVLARLELGLRIKQGLRLTLRLYLKREEFFTGLYGEALEHRMVQQYQKHGMRFEYALVDAKKVAHLKQYGMAFSHCLYNPFDAFFSGRKYALARGTWLLFVVRDMYPKMPQQFLEYAAVHERGEQVTLGEHHLATKLEFAIAQKERKLREYMAWIEQSCPEKFADVFSYQRHVELPESEELDKALEIFASSEEARTIKRFIEYFEWPSSVLRKLDWYHAQNNAAITVLNHSFQAAHAALHQHTTSIAEIVHAARCVLEEGLALVRVAQHCLSAVRMEEFWGSARKELGAEFLKMLQPRQDDPAYIEQIAEANIARDLPHDGALALSFQEALRSIEK